MITTIHNCPLCGKLPEYEKTKPHQYCVFHELSCGCGLHAGDHIDDADDRVLIPRVAMRWNELVNSINSLRNEPVTDWMNDGETFREYERRLVRAGRVEGLTMAKQACELEYREYDKLTLGGVQVAIDELIKKEQQ